MKKKQQKREIITRTGNVGRKITPYETKDGEPAIRFSLGVDTDRFTEWYTCFLHGDAALKALGEVANPAGGEPLECERLAVGSLVQIRGFYEEVKKMGKPDERHINVYKSHGLVYVSKSTWSTTAKKRFAAMKRQAAKA